MYFGCDITKKDRNTEIRVNFGEFRGDVCNQLILNTIKKKTEYDSCIRSREMALGREPCAKSWH